MDSLKRLLALLLVAVLPFAGVAADDLVQLQSTNLASLIAPDKLATLRKRGANPRIQKAVAILEARSLGAHLLASTLHQLLNA